MRKGFLLAYKPVSQYMVALLSLQRLTKRLATSCGLFSFAFYAWLFVVFSTASLGQNAILLNLAVETFQSGLKRLTIIDFDF